MNKSSKIWLVLLIFTFLGIILKCISQYTYKKELILQKGEEANIKIIRLVSSDLKLSIIFKNGSKGLGNSRLKNSTTYNQDGYLDYEDPGEPIILSIDDGKQSRFYEAKPNYLNCTNCFDRGMFPYENDNNPNIFSYPESKIPSFIINKGFNNLQIKVLNVGKTLENVKVILEISPDMYGILIVPLVPLYHFLWIFNFWPLFFIILFISYKYIRKNLNNNSIISNFIFDYLIYYILLVPVIYFFAFLFSNSFIVTFCINLITMPLFLQKKYSLNNNIYKIIVWSIWLIISGFLLYITLDNYTLFGQGK